VLDLVLYRPQIPPNTGNIMRLCANTGARLHLVGPIGFDLTDAALRRAGLDYRDAAVVTVHESWQQVRRALPGRWFAVDTCGTRSHAQVSYLPGDVLLFGRERTGLPAQVLAEFPSEAVLRIPMVPGSRSLNLANAAAVALYEAWRQIGFAGASQGALQ
jgi:tRNA (cytidine/uridine-2'-O-)-methyltransferase